MKYISKKGLKISTVLSHKDMWIVDNQKGKFHTLNASEESIKKIHPPQ